jgi:hypothetical protein
MSDMTEPYQQEPRATFDQAVRTIAPFAIVAWIAWRKGKASGIASVVAQASVAAESIIPTAVDIIDDTHLEVLLSNGRIFPFVLKTAY